MTISQSPRDASVANRANSLRSAGIITAPHLTLTVEVSTNARATVPSVEGSGVTSRRLCPPTSAFRATEEGCFTVGGAGTWPRTTEGGAKMYWNVGWAMEAKPDICEASTGGTGCGAAGYGPGANSAQS